MARHAGAARPPGRPRSARVDEAVIEAVLDLLAARTPVDSISIEAIAARAGVGKAAIYRRWPNKDALLLDAIRTLKGTPPEPTGESLRQDLIMLTTPLTEAPDPRAGTIMSWLVPQVHHNPAHYRLYQDFVEQRREVLRQVLRRGVASGELRADLDIELTTLLLSAPAIVQAMVRWHPGIDDATLAERVVDAVLAGIVAR